MKDSLKENESKSIECELREISEIIKRFNNNNKLEITNNKIDKKVSKWYKKLLNNIIRHI